MGFNLASFKNSRSYPRPATTTAQTDDVIIPGLPGGPFLLLPADLNRVDATIYNRHATDTFQYFYRNPGDPIPTLAQIAADGFDVIAGAAMAIVSPEECWTASTTVNPIPVDMDIGSG